MNALILNEIVRELNNLQTTIIARSDVYPYPVESLGGKWAAQIYSEYGDPVHVTKYCFDSRHEVEVEMYVAFKAVRQQKFGASRTSRSDDADQTIAA